MDRRSAATVARELCPAGSFPLNPARARQR